jgi:ferric-dicitrate binding protein FerR (iron transport regulator)
MENKPLTKEEQEIKIVREIIQEIVKLEKKYPQPLVKRACYRYNNAMLEKKKAEREIKALEQKLEQAKKKLI